LPREPTWNGTFDTLARVGAASVGSLPPAVLGGLLLARLLPVAEATATTTGVLLVVPGWVAMAVGVLLFRSAGRAWAVCVVTSVLLALAAWALGPLPP